MTAFAPLVDWLTTPLAYAFMQRGLMVSTMVGILCAVIGCYVVLRSMAFLGDAMAHAILPGVAVAYLLKGNLMVGALVAATGVVRLETLDQVLEEHVSARHRDKLELNKQALRLGAARIAGQVIHPAVPA